MPRLAVLNVKASLTYVFRQSIPFPRINPLQPNRPLLPQPRSHPLRIRLPKPSTINTRNPSSQTGKETYLFILQRDNRRHALPFTFPRRDPEPTLECRSDEQLMYEANLVALRDVLGRR